MQFEPNFWRKWFDEWFWVLAQPAGLAVTFVAAIIVCAFVGIPYRSTNFPITMALLGYLIGYTVTYFLKEYTEKIWKKEAEERNQKVDAANKKVADAEMANQQLMLRIAMLRRTAEIRKAAEEPEDGLETKAAYQGLIQSMISDGLVTPRGANYLRKFLHLPENWER